MRDTLKLCENLFKKLPDAVIIDKEHGYFYIKNFLWYIDGKLSVEKRDELSSLIIEHLPKDDGEKLMTTIAESYIDEGVSKGMLIGEARGEARGAEKEKSLIAQKMLKENTDIQFISSVTGLSTDELLKIQNKM